MIVPSMSHPCPSPKTLSQLVIQVPASADPTWNPVDQLLTHGADDRLQDKTGCEPAAGEPCHSAAPSPLPRE